MPNELIPMSTWTPKDGQTYEIVDADARERLDDAEERLDDLEQGGGGGGGGGSGTVRSVNNVQPDSNGNVSLSANDVGAGTYSKPSGGIPASDLATGVIPSVPAMASELDMSDWDNGKTVDAAVLAADFTAALTSLNAVAVRLEALADSDDTTLDQLSEIVAYIKNNKSLIDGVTTSKVSVTDIVNSLVSTETGKPLSAAQGRALKALIDAIVVPTAVSQLTNDEGFQTAAQVQTAIAQLQPKSINDTGGYFTTDTVDGALQEIGAELAGINTLIGSGVIS